MTERYDSGLLNDFGGGNVDWWWDYIRAEVERCNDFHADIHDAAVSAARKEGWDAAIDAMKVEIGEWLALPAIPPKNPRAEVYDEACSNIMRFVCDLKPPAETTP